MKWFKVFVGMTAAQLIAVSLKRFLSFVFFGPRPCWSSLCSRPQDFVDLIRNKTGLNHTDVKSVWSVHDTLFCEVRIHTLTHTDTHTLRTYSFILTAHWKHLGLRPKIRIRDKWSAFQLDPLHNLKDTTNPFFQMRKLICNMYPWPVWCPLPSTPEDLVLHRDIPSGCWGYSQWLCNGSDWFAIFSPHEEFLAFQP